MECVDKFTGEVVEVEYASNRYIPVSDYSVNNEPSMTVPDQVEPIEITVKRCLRGELLDVGKTPYYEFDQNVNIDTVNFNDTEKQGFDLADIPDLLEASAVSVEATNGTVALNKDDGKANSNNSEKSQEPQVPNSTAKSDDATVSSGSPK